MLGLLKNVRKYETVRPTSSLLSCEVIAGISTPISVALA
jgi:hypothetical protein